MRTPPFNLHLPTTVSEAVQISAELRAEGRETDWVAGGTDLLPNYKWHLNAKKDVISLAHIDEITTISMTEIGAMARLSEIADGGKAHPLVADAARKVASSLIRNSATLGGKYFDLQTSLAQQLAQRRITNITLLAFERQAFRHPHVQPDNGVAPRQTLTKQPPDIAAGPGNQYTAHHSTSLGSALRDQIRARTNSVTS